MAAAQNEKERVAAHRWGEEMRRKNEKMRPNLITINGGDFQKAIDCLFFLTRALFLFCREGKWWKRISSYFTTLSGTDEMYSLTECEICFFKAKYVCEIEGFTWANTGNDVGKQVK